MTKRNWFQDADIQKSINIIHYINKLQEKNHMIKSIHAEKVFGKIHYSIMIKTLWKIET